MEKLKKIIVTEDTIFLTTLDKNGKPIIDENGHENTYDMPMKKFVKKGMKSSPIKINYRKAKIFIVYIEMKENYKLEEKVMLLEIDFYYGKPGISGGRRYSIGKMHKRKKII